MDPKIESSLLVFQCLNTAVEGVWFLDDEEPTALWTCCEGHERLVRAEESGIVCFTCDGAPMYRCEEVEKALQ